jgi:hypothetical protein
MTILTERPDRPVLLDGHIHVLFQVELHVQNDNDDDHDDFRLQMGHHTQ